MKLADSCWRCVYLLGVVIVCFVPSGAQPTTPEAPYLNPNLPIEVRLDDLISRMTLKEKVGQLNIPELYSETLGKDKPTKREACEKLAAGSYNEEIGAVSGFFSVADSVHDSADVRQRAEYFNKLQTIARTQTRLKIPLLEDEEGTHGAKYPGATVFPEGLAIGSSFDLELVGSVYAAAAEEARCVGIHILSTLVMELNRDPRMGRNEEAYTEDPYLGMRIGETIVHATQGNDVASPDKVVALLTDFPTQNAPASGLERGAVEFSERSLRENDMLPWVGTITKAGALGVMAAYPEIEDEPAHASAKWMNDVLRQELGFQGVVESEGGGFQTLVDEDIVPNQKEAGILSLRAGVDLDISYEQAYMGPLVEAVEEGRVPMSLIDRAVRRVLRLKFQLGLFDHPYVDVDRAARVVHSPQNQDLALRAAREGIVLLKNDNNLLPLRPNLTSIAVIGPNADNIVNQLGDYSPSKPPPGTITVLEGIKAAVTHQTKLSHVRGCEITGTDKSGFEEAVRAAKSAEAAIVVVGENEETDGEGNDVASLDLSGVQEDLVRAVYETGTPTIVVLINGRPLSTRWVSDHVPAFVEAWHPGEFGGRAVADVLFGNYNPSGRLPVSVPRHSGQLPVYYNYKPSKAYWTRARKNSYADMPATPLYPFGYGLSYTTYAYSNLRIEPASIRPGGHVAVTFDVTNTGQTGGVETVQLYLHEKYAPVSTPVKRLRGFERVALEPGQKKTVVLNLTPEDLQLLDLDMQWRVVPGDFEIMVGSSSADIDLEGSLSVKP